MKTVQVSLRTEADRKSRVDSILAELGYSLTAALNGTIQYIDEYRDLPFVLRTEVKTLAGINNAIISALSALCLKANSLYVQVYKTEKIRRTVRDDVIFYCNEFSALIEKEYPVLKEAGVETVSTCLRANDNAKLMAYALQFHGRGDGLVITLSHTQITPEISVLNQCLEAMERLILAKKNVLSISEEERRALSAVEARTASAKVAMSGTESYTTRLNAQREIAVGWRRDNRMEASGGYVLINETRVLGWCPQLDLPEGLVPGSIAFNGEDGAWVATGGSDMLGAMAWVPVWKDYD